MKNNNKKIEALKYECEILNQEHLAKLNKMCDEIRELEIANRPKPILHSKALTDPFGWNKVKLIKGDHVKTIRQFNASLVFDDWVVVGETTLYVRLSDDEFIFSHVLEKDDHQTKS